MPQRPARPSGSRQPHLSEWQARTQPPPGAIEEVVQNVEHAAHEVEEEVEAKAAMGFLGGPIVWALLVILALLLVYGFAM